MSSNNKTAIADLVRERGHDFSREDKRQLDELIVTHGDLDESHEIEATVYEGLWLIVASPEYRGDLTIEELES